MRIHYALVLIALSFGAISTQAASFDCAKAVSAVEKLICENPALSDLDEQMARAYREKVAIDPELSRTEQRVWISETRNRCVDGGCLYTAYRNRINTLTGDAEILTPQAPSPPTQPKLDSQSAIDITGATGSPILNSNSGASKPGPKVVPPTELPAQNSSTNLAVQVDAQTGDRWIWLQIGGALLAAVVGFSIYRHKSTGLVIYSNYTDALITGLAPIVFLMTYFALIYLKVTEQRALYAAGFFGLLLLVLVARVSYRDNGGNLFNLVLALTTKITVVGVFYFAMCFLLFGFATSERKKGERLDCYEARKRREAKASKAALAAFAAGCIALVAWLCKREEFISIAEYVTSDQKTANA